VNNADQYRKKGNERTVADETIRDDDNGIVAVEVIVFIVIESGRNETNQNLGDDIILVVDNRVVVGVVADLDMYIE
jgi:hypothetical protein